LKNRSCSIDHIDIEAEHERWAVRYRDRWNGPGITYVLFPPEPMSLRIWYEPDVVLLMTLLVLLVFGVLIALLA
jgi:hypothetical protein